MCGVDAKFGYEGLDGGEHFIDVLLDIVISEPEDAQAEVFEVLLSRFVFEMSSVVRCTIQFDDDRGFGAVEINDEAINRVLAAKLQFGELLALEPLPQELFGACWMSTHVACD